MMPELSEFDAEELAGRFRAMEAPPMLVKALTDAVVIQTVVGSPDGQSWASVEVPGGYDDVKRLPKVLEIAGVLYGFSAWNSDALVAYYRTGVVIGRAVSPRRARQFQQGRMF
jgi:hypothetical protein